MRGSTLALIGLPGVGKTSLALRIAADAARPTLVLHTDVLKVTLRCAGLFPAGPIWAGDIEARLAAVRPFLDAHARKAAADGYRLVVEGTLAIGFEADLVVLLELDEEERGRRVGGKSPGSRVALAMADLGPLRARIGAVRPDRVLDAGAPLATLVERVEDAWR